MARRDGDQQVVTVTETLGEVLGMPDELIEQTVGELIQAGRLIVVDFGDGTWILALS